MSAGRVIGGVIALIAGIFVLIACFMVMGLVFALGTGEIFIQWILNLVIGILALVGGIMGLASKSGGGAAMVAGILSLVLGILSVTVVAFIFIGIQYSLFELLMTLGPWFGITLEAILMMLGAIIMLASGKE